MLRITITEESESAIMRLEGKLVGPWVEELRQCWHKILRQVKGRAVIADLGEVTFVDAPGKKLLQEMRTARVKLVGRGVLTNYILEQIERSRAS